MRDRTRKTRSRGAWAGALAMAMLLALAGPVAAQDDEEEEDPFAGLYRKPGFYIGAMASYQIPTEKNQLENEADRRLDAIFGPGTSTDVDNSWGLNGRVGYRAHEHFSVETQFEWLNRIELDSRVLGGMKQKTEISLFALTGNLKGYLLGRGKVQPYVVGGAGWGQSRTNPRGAGGPNERDDGFVYRLGAGVDLYGKPDIALSLEASYVVPEGNLDDLEYVSIGAGLTLRFFPGGY